MSQVVCQIVVVRVKVLVPTRQNCPAVRHSQESNSDIVRNRSHRPLIDRGSLGAQCQEPLIDHLSSQCSIVRDLRGAVSQVDVKRYSVWVCRDRSQVEHNLLML